MRRQAGWRQPRPSSSLTSAVSACASWSWAPPSAAAVATPPWAAWPLDVHAQVAGWGAAWGAWLKGSPRLQQPAPNGASACLCCPACRRRGVVLAAGCVALHRHGPPGHGGAAAEGARRAACRAARRASAGTARAACSTAGAAPATPAPARRACRLGRARRRLPPAACRRR